MIETDYAAINIHPAIDGDSKMARLKGKALGVLRELEGLAPPHF